MFEGLAWNMAWNMVLDLCISRWASGKTGLEKMVGGLLTGIQN
jgi:hypothetical protein